MSGRGWQGPVAATILADFGADVIKVEMPGRGDPFRYLPRTQNTPGVDVNYTWIMDGRNKRSITLDLESAEGQEVAQKADRRVRRLPHQPADGGAAEDGADLRGYQPAQ